MTKNDEKFLTPGYTFALIVVVAGIALFSVYNVVKVNSLLVEVRTMEYTRDSLVSVANRLRNEVLRLESADRIHRVAEERLHLVQPTNAPIVIDQLGGESSKDEE